MMTEGESEQFSLRWNNFHSNLTSGFHALLQGEDLVDVTLAAGGQFVQAHKIVLSVCSPYFKELFKVNPCKHPIVILKDVCHKELVAILQFMYQGEVNVRQEELATFLKTAEMLQIKGLTGDDSPSEEESTSSTPSAPQATVRQRAPRRTTEKPPPPVRSTPDKAVPLVETVIAEPEDVPTPPFKRLRPEVPSPVITTSPIVTEEHSSVEMDIKNPKQEPLEYDPEIEEVDRIQNRDDALVQLLGGESSHALQDSSQGPSIFSGIQGASQDSGLQDSGQGLQFIETSKGRALLTQNGYIYRMNRQSGDKRFWICSEYKKDGCRARCVTVGDQMTRDASSHNHSPREDKIRVKLELARLWSSLKLVQP